jgi:uncharacterized protein
VSGLGTPDLGVGIGLRPVHYAQVLAEKPPVPWFEVISENFMGLRVAGGGRPWEILERVRRDYPVVLHGVSLNVGSADPLRLDYLARLSRLAREVEPAWISDHLCWTGFGGENLHDLLPLPFTEDALRHVASRVARVQEALGRRILLENVSSYLTYRHSEMPEWTFLSEVARRADCGILLDVNNVYVSAVNHGFDPDDFLEGIPADRVGQMHLAGHSRDGEILVDTHDHPVSRAVWDLYARAVRRFGSVSTLIEWDERIPSLSRLRQEAERAQRIREAAPHETQPAALAG